MVVRLVGSLMDPSWTDASHEPTGGLGVEGCAFAVPDAAAADAVLLLVVNTSPGKRAVVPEVVWFVWFWHDDDVLKSWETAAKSCWSAACRATALASAWAALWGGWAAFCCASSALILPVAASWA